MTNIQLIERLRAMSRKYANTIGDEAASAIELLARERDEYKVWWERDSAGLGKTLNELSLERACKQDFRAQSGRLREALREIVSTRREENGKRIYFAAGHMNCVMIAEYALPSVEPEPGK